MTIKIIPLAVTVVKTGKATKDGKTFDWTISKVDCSLVPSGERKLYSTFDDFNGKLNSEVEVEMEVKVTEKNGNTYKNETIKLPRRNVWKELDELRSKIDRLEKLVVQPKQEQPNKEVLPDMDVDGADFSAEDLPF